MTRIELNPEERDLLVEILNGALGDLRSEISNTDTSTYRETLKDREAMMRKFLVMLGAPAS